MKTSLEPKDNGKLSQSDTAQKGQGRRRFMAALPLIIFLALAGIFSYQLLSGKDASELPSVLIGKDAPETNLRPLEGLMVNGQQLPGWSSEELKGEVTVINIWASWCVPCRQEHPLLVELGKDDRFNVFGFNYKDKTENALSFLNELGNSYEAVGVDPTGRSFIDWGAYGVPETFVVDANGKIVFKHVGPLSPESIQKDLMPVIEKALAEKSQTENLKP